MGSSLFKKLCEYYEIDESQYEELIRPVDEYNFDDGHTFDQMQNAVNLVKEVVKNQGKIFIYGDYDADGIMGTSILVKMFSYINYPVESYLPNRYVDGYGITLSKAEECAKKGINLVITVDNGIGAIEQIDLLKNNGIKVLVLDHHALGEVLPKADVILHPTYSNFGDISTSGAFVSFMFSRAFLNRYDKYLATLAAISLISDMMPLKEYNRNLLRLVINNYKNSEFTCIDALKEEDTFDDNSIGMKIAPKINAIGRMIETNEINHLIEYFTSENQEKVLTYLNWINETNELRKEISKKAVESLDGVDLNSPSIIYICNEKEGILGLIANFLMIKYKKPTIVLTLDSSKMFYKGSARAPEGSNLVQIFNNIKDLLFAYGGHNLAAGCTISIENITKFKEEFNNQINLHPIEVKEKKTISLNISEVNFDSYNLVKTFSPFGESWKKPLFKISHVSVSSLRYSKTGEHIITQIGTSSRITGFNISRDTLKNLNLIDIIGNLKFSSYRNLSYIEFLISEYKIS